LFVTVSQISVNYSKLGICKKLNANVGVQGIYSGVFDHSEQRIAQHTHHPPTLNKEYRQPANSMSTQLYPAVSLM